MKFRLTHKPIDPTNMIIPAAKFNMQAGCFWLRQKARSLFDSTGYVQIGFHHATQGLNIEIDVPQGDYILGIGGTRYKKEISIKLNSVGILK